MQQMTDGVQLILNGVLMRKMMQDKIIDNRKLCVQVVISENVVTIFKDKMYLCTLQYSSNFNEILAGFFNDHVGFTGKTLRDIADVLDDLNKYEGIS